MANNRIQIKRTSVAGRTANTTDSGNSQYIAAGEFALNMVDRILYTSNGTTLITVGANLVNQSVTGNLTVKAIIANSTLGTANQVLTTNGTGVYWADAAAGGGSSNAVYMKGGAATIGTLDAGGSNIFRVNANTLNYNTTFAAGENASATGPIAVAGGVTLTVQTGARVSIV
jgi:hypothetical protein